MDACTEAYYTGFRQGWVKRQNTCPFAAQSEEAKAWSRGYQAGKNGFLNVEGQRHFWPLKQSPSSRLTG